MNISIEITPEMFEFVCDRVDSGDYKSRSEVIRAALRKMIKQDTRRRGTDPLSGENRERIKELVRETVAEMIEEKKKGK